MQTLKTTGIILITKAIKVEYPNTHTKTTNNTIKITIFINKNRIKNQEKITITTNIIILKNNLIQITVKNDYNSYEDIQNSDYESKEYKDIENKNK